MSAPNQYRPSDQSDHQYNPQDHYGFNDSSNTQQRFGAYHTAESDSSTHAWQADGGYRRPHFVPSINQPAYGCSMREAFLRFWKKALDFRGRASRSEFWWWMLCDLLIVIMASLVIASLYRSTGGSGFPRAVFGRFRSCGRWRQSFRSSRFPFADCTIPVAAAGRSPCYWSHRSPARFWEIPWV